jgi:hypothetical protein
MTYSHQCEMVKDYAHQQATGQSRLWGTTAYEGDTMAFT